MLYSEYAWLSTGSLRTQIFNFCDYIIIESTFTQNIISDIIVIPYSFALSINLRVDPDSL